MNERDSYSPWRILILDGIRYQIVLRGERSVNELLLDLRHDLFKAKNLLRKFTQDHQNLSRLRHLLQHDLADGQWPPDDEETIRKLAAHFAAGRFSLVPLSHSPLIPVRLREKAPQETIAIPRRPAKVLPSAEEIMPKSWIKIRIIDDESGRPIEGIPLQLIRANQLERQRTSAANGMVVFEMIEEGQYSVKCSLDQLGQQTANHQPTGPTIFSTFAFLSIAETGDHEPDSKEASIVATAVANVKQHPVKKGDTLESLAKSTKFSWQKLAAFNYCTADPETLCQRLGCQPAPGEPKTAVAKADLHQLDEEEQIFIPEPWQEANLATEKVYQIRVKPIPIEIRMWYQLDLDDPQTKDDTIIIETEDGDWRHEIPVSGLTEVEPDWVELKFPRPPPGQRYTMTQDLGAEDGIFTIFHLASESIFWQAFFPELETEEEAEASDERQEQDELDEAKAWDEEKDHYFFEGQDDEGKEPEPWDEKSWDEEPLEFEDRWTYRGDY